MHTGRVHLSAFNQSIADWSTPFIVLNSPSEYGPNEQVIFCFSNDPEKVRSISNGILLPTSFAIILYVTVNAHEKTRSSFVGL